MTAGTGDNVSQYFRMTSPGLPLLPAPEVTTPGDEEQDDNHSQDGRESGQKAGPMHVDEADYVIGLVDGRLFVRDLGVDREVSVVGNDDGRRSSGAIWVAILGDVLLDEELSLVVVDDALPIAE